MFLSHSWFIQLPSDLVLWLVLCLAIVVRPLFIWDLELYFLFNLTFCSSPAGSCVSLLGLFLSEVLLTEVDNSEE